MKKIIIVLVFLLIHLIPASAVSKNFVLPGLVNPLMIAVDNEQLYVSDQCCVKIFSLKTCKMINSIGSKGEGPLEFKINPFVKVINDKVYIADPYKYILVTKQGKLLEEQRFPFYTGRTSPINENWVIAKMVNPEKNKIGMDVLLLDKDFSIQKTLRKGKCKTMELGQPNYLIKPFNTFRCLDDKIVLMNGSEGFNIEIFSYTGQKIRTINKPYKKLRITEAHKEAEIQYLMARVQSFKKRWERNKKRYLFPEFLPAIRDIFVTHNRIYVKTYCLKEGKEEFVILDWQGNILKTVYLPTSWRHHFAFVENTFYFLKENEDAEEWELFSEAIPWN